MLHLLRSLYCFAIICQHELPSDPIAAQRVSVRSSRLLSSDGSHFDGYDFSKGKMNPIVNVSAGRLEGYVMKSIKGRSIYAFEGVPYAETTGGANRFKLPVPKAPWSGILPAKKPGDFCIQLHTLHFLRMIGSEDCLSVNIYIPSDPILTWKKNLPVIVWFHGGSWYFGSGTEYGPAYLLEHDVILVTVNYRLGIFGYLSTGDKELPGNLGQKDQRLALKWVHENIANFGGDPSRVTIAGQSAGGASVHFHILANSSHKYFSRAISMSGNAYCPWAIMTKRHIKLKNRRLSKSTGCPLTTSKQFVDCLRKMSSRDLVQKFLSLFEFLILPVAPLGLVIEDDHPDAFLTEHPDEIYARNGAAKVPYICSRIIDEFPLTLEAFENIQERFSRIRPNSGRSVEALFRFSAPLFLEYKLTTDNPNSVTDKLIDFYLKSEIGNARLANVSAIGKLGLDRMFAYGTHKTLQRHSQLAPTYSYMFGYKGRGSTVSSVIGLNHKDVGVCHMDDMINVFNISTGWDAYKTTDPEYAIVKLMTSLFYNFADKGEPLYTDESGNGNNHRIWNPVTDPRNIQVLQIDEEVKMIPEQNTQRLKFWESLDLPDMKPFIPFD